MWGQTVAGGEPGCERVVLTCRLLPEPPSPRHRPQPQSQRLQSPRKGRCTDGCGIRTSTVRRHGRAACALWHEGTHRVSRLAPTSRRRSLVDWTCHSVRATPASKPQWRYPSLAMYPQTRECHDRDDQSSAFPRVCMWKNGSTTAPTSIPPLDAHPPSITTVPGPLGPSSRRTRRVTSSSPCWKRPHFASAALSTRSNSCLQSV
mmetsp:Transcript_7552/g.24805  ORF Transcript_7552/g.24805 Transcript_7552/m.24805 type:complete len:204 (+) Transcript_7552:239-850(+)